MSKLLLILLIVVLALSAAAPTLAQDEAPVGFGYTRTDIVLIVVGVVVAGALIFGRSLAVEAIRSAKERIPETGITIDLTPVENRLRDMVNATPNPIDDVLFEQIREMLKGIVEEAMEEQKEEILQAVQVSAQAGVQAAINDNRG